MNINKTTPFFSVITVVYNGAAKIKETLFSVFNQKYTNYEYIVIDGNSTDATLSILSSYSEKIDFLISEQDNGVYDAMNKALNMARGEWVLFMNCGDCFYDGNVLNYIYEQIHPNSSVIYGDTINIIANEKYYIKAKNLNTLANKGMPFCHQSVLVRTEIVKKEQFDLQYKILADYDFFRKLYLGNYKFQYINTPISVYNNDGGLSFNNPLLMFKERSIITQSYLKRKKYNFSLMLLKMKLVVMRLTPTLIISLYRKVKYKRYKEMDLE